MRYLTHLLPVAGTVFLVLGCAAATEPELGMTSDGKLSPCPDSPNCVSSDAPDEGHAIAPLAIKGDVDTAWRALIEHLMSQPRVEIKEQTKDYLRAEARTRLLRFTDDVEFSLRAVDKQIAMRSASRVGYSDLGANRKRLESVRRALVDAGVVENGG